MAYKLTIREFVSKQLPGDRAREKVDSSIFEVCLGSDRRDKAEEVILRSFDQYDGFYCSVGDREETFNKATRYAHEIAQFMKINEPKLVKMVEKVVSETKWVEAEDA